MIPPSGSIGLLVQEDHGTYALPATGNLESFAKLLGAEIFETTALGEECAMLVNWRGGGEIIRCAVFFKSSKIVRIADISRSQLASMIYERWQKEVDMKFLDKNSTSIESKPN
jgi:hypothetical protein